MTPALRRGNLVAAGWANATSRKPPPNPLPQAGGRSRLAYGLPASRWACALANGLKARRHQIQASKPKFRNSGTGPFQPSSGPSSAISLRRPRFCCGARGAAAGRSLGSSRGRSVRGGRASRIGSAAGSAATGASSRGGAACACGSLARAGLSAAGFAARGLRPLGAREGAASSVDSTAAIASAAPTTSILVPISFWILSIASASASVTKV